MSKLISYLIVLSLILSLSEAFERNADLKVSVNKVSPFSNPIESYRLVNIDNPINILIFERYYDLPFCQPEQIIEESQTFGEKLSGNRKMNSLYEIQYPGIECTILIN